MKYRDEDMEKLVPLSEMVLDRELVSIFRDTLRDGSRPSALTLLKYPALKNGEPRFQRISSCSSSIVIVEHCHFIVVNRCSQ